jgi:23S rRNA pseudouridine1911/1915/1917 synthase
MNGPRVIAETGSYVVVYKPPGMHSAPLARGDAETLLDWCAALYPDLREPRGRLTREGGLVHRLDFETSGLVLIARTQEALDSLEGQQKQGLFIKEYEALSVAQNLASPLRPLPGFPKEGPFPGEPPQPPFTIASAFRPYGPGRKAARPVVFPAGVSPKEAKREIATGGPYETVCLESCPGTCRFQISNEQGEFRQFRLQIRRGFRHQIRCHLAWLGFPILNDRLYGGQELKGEGTLALSARAFSFRDPESGQDVRYEN